VPKVRGVFSSFPHGGGSGESTLRNYARSLKLEPQPAVSAAAPDSPDGQLSQGHPRLVLAAVLGLAVVLRLINANAELWWDEIVTVLKFVRPPLATIVSTYDLAGNHVLSSVLTNISASVLGEEPWALRVPAIVFGVAGVWAFWFVACAVWRSTPAMAGTFLFAVSYHHIYYSQNARGYTALIFFGLVATGCLLRLCADDGRPHPGLHVGYAAAVGFGLYSLPLMVFIVAGHGLILTLLRRWRLIATLTAGVCLGALLYAPMAGSLFAYYRQHPADTGYRLFSRQFLAALGPLLPVLAGASGVMVLLVIRLARRTPLAAGLFLIPVLFNVAVPAVRGQGVYPRAFMWALPVAYLLLVEAIDWGFRRRRALAAGGVAIVALVSIVKLVPYYRLPKQGFQQALAFIEAHRAPHERRAGVTLGGKAARFYNPEFVLLEDAGQARAWTRESREPAWIVSTFAAELRSSSPDLYVWLQAETVDRAEFAGVIGDGTVHVHYWRAH
jgi:mannosyltransferase